jgi:hypothetical protein
VNGVIEIVVKIVMMKMINMATITEDYVSFETAKLLKEKGFSENTICKYADVGGITEKWYDDYRERVLHFDWNEGYLIEPSIELKDQYEIIGNTISAPTLQMTMKWLRKVHNIHINLDIHWLHFANKNGWMYIIVRILENGTEFVDAKGDSNDKHFYSTYEEACETAIKYCLVHLI